MKSSTRNTRYQDMALSARDATATTSESPKDYTKVNQPATTLKESLQAIPGITPALYQGISVFKLTTGGVWKPRILTLSRDHLALFVTHHRVKNTVEGMVAKVASSLPIPLWTPSKGFSLSSNKTLQDRYVRCIDVADFNRVQVGVVGTQLLETSTKGGPSNKNRSPYKYTAPELVTIHHRGNQLLTVWIDNATERDALVKALKEIRSKYEAMQPVIAKDAMLLRYVWYDVDTDRSGMISASEFAKVCQQINFDIDANKAFRTAVGNKGGKKELTYAECRSLLQSLRSDKTQKADIWSQVFPKIDNDATPRQVLDQFLHLAQGETQTTLHDAESLLRYMALMDLDTAPPTKTTPSLTLGKSAFAEYLYSAENDAYDPLAQCSPTAPLDKPISEYWINTSHNTYLLGDQLQSKSSVQAYVTSLNRGCKCLELDCWDSDEDHTPIVFHGHTLTSKITFESILYVVQNYLQDHPDTYPIILSLENHCSHGSQRTMARLMEEIFGDKLFVPTETGDKDPLPSPESLRGKIVIKGKRPPEPDEGKEKDNGKDDPKDEVDPYDDALAAGDKPKPGKLGKIVPELARLTLFHGTKFKDFDTSIAQAPSHMHSIGESKITKLVGKTLEDPSRWRRYNQEHMTRTYPAGVRVDSSNYNPVLAWSMGCQLVALNFQTHDTPLYLNDGRFRQGGGCGYVLKPDSVLRRADPTTQVVQIRVVSGYCLPKPKGEKGGEAIDPYIKIQLHDVCHKTLDDKNGGRTTKEEYYTAEHETASINNNGFCPVWNTDPDKNGTVTFQVQHVEVAMLMFQMVDADIVADDKIACAAIPVAHLRQGYRSIQLYDHNNTRTGPFQYATLLVKIDFEEVDEV